MAADKVKFLCIVRQKKKRRIKMNLQPLDLTELQSQTIEISYLGGVEISLGPEIFLRFSVSLLAFANLVSKLLHYNTTVSGTLSTVTL